MIKKEGKIIKETVNELEKDFFLKNDIYERDYKTKLVI